MKDVFVDTGYFIALVHNQDSYHQTAKKWAKRIVAEKFTCHTTIPVVFEIADGFSRLSRRDIGIDLLENIFHADNFIVYPFEERIYEKALDLYKSRTDKEWSLTDCYSFELMNELNLTEALTADNHFEQYGYKILLK